MTYRIMTKSEFVMESEVDQTGSNYIQKASPLLFLQVFKEEVQAVSDLCHSFKGLTNISYRDIIMIIVLNKSRRGKRTKSYLPEEGQ